ncbi:hypothetical protein AOQ84DRAFT_359396, partial [Glonium stellatum]
MSPPRHRTILLTGAPGPKDLNWDNSLLKNNFIPSIKAFLDLQNANLEKSPNATLEESPPTSPIPKWRSVPLDPQTHLPTGLSQPFAEFSSPSIRSMSFEEPYDRKGVSFESDSDLTSTIWEASESMSSISSSKFLEHSFAFHETLLSSQIAPRSSPANVPEPTSNASFATTTSIDTTTTDNSSVRALQDLQDVLPPGPTVTNPTTTANATLTALTITPLSALPNAPHLLSIHPQTPTPNLLVALLATPPPRTVT